METGIKKNPYPILADTSRSLKWRFQNSLAAMTVTTSYLTQLEQIEFQALNKWWYGRAAERIQRKVFLENTFYFELGRSVFAYNKLEGVTKLELKGDTKLYKPECWTSIQVGQDSLYRAAW